MYRTISPKVKEFSVFSVFIHYYLYVQFKKYLHRVKTLNRVEEFI